MAQSKYWVFPLKMVDLSTAMLNYQRVVGIYIGYMRDINWISWGIESDTILCQLQMGLPGPHGRLTYSHRNPQVDGKRIELRIQSFSQTLFSRKKTPPSPKKKGQNPQPIFEPLEPLNINPLETQNHRKPHKPLEPAPSFPIALDFRPSAMVVVKEPIQRACSAASKSSKAEKSSSQHPNKHENH